ncbi:MAG TPA: aromatic ring-hydroxylating dioxygenase subunit alpha, partial [Steroidobacteraceae bacterium]|nr:aromatic ring-hydroxylating dioxygenase subunit alpha [Steroidobacteraceae bacterium]
MFINFWYPVVRSQDLGATPLGVRILAHDFVAFRDGNGRPAVLSDTCVHRGGSLSGGKCKDDGTVQCPYHGWRYNSRGECTRIPSLGINAKIPPRARVDAYPVEERYGIVFAFLGDVPEAERPPIMPVPEHGTPEWRATVATFDVDYYYERSIENGLDPAHNEYVHPTHGYQGERESEYRVNELRPHLNNPWGFGFMHTFDAPPLRKSIMRFARRQGGKMDAGSGTFGPNQMWTLIHFSATAQMHQYMFEAPIDEKRTRVFLLTERNQRFFFRKGLLSKLNGWLDTKVDERNRVIAGQDIKVVQRLRPVLTPPSTAKELLMPHDKVIVQYREKLREFEQRGWRIDAAALRQARDRG